MVELLGVLGGSAGFLYAMGYLVLAGHSRVLGLPLRSTDTGTLLLSAWEFLTQGTLYVVLRTLQAFSPVASLWGMAAVLGAAMLVAWLRRKVALRNKWSRAAARSIDRHSTFFALTVAFALLMLQAFHVAAHVVPSMAVTSLLSVPNPVPPFPPMRPLLREFFEQHWNDVRTSIVGNGLESDWYALSRLFVIHVAVAGTSSIVAIWLWWWTRHRNLARFPRWTAGLIVVCSAFLWLYTPLYYGVTMKSYRYPLVRLMPADEKDGRVVAEFRRTSLRPRFLLQATDADYVLFDSEFREIDFVKRDLVGIVKVSADDFLFSNTNP